MGVCWAEVQQRLCSPPGLLWVREGGRFEDCVLTNSLPGDGPQGSSLDIPQQGKRLMPLGFAPAAVSQSGELGPARPRTELRDAASRRPLMERSLEV